jgi:hypothetical protein
MQITRRLFVTGLSAPLILTMQGSPKLCRTYPKASFTRSSGSLLRAVRSELPLGVRVGFRYRFPRCFRLVPEQHECGVPPANETEEHTGSDGHCDAL